jgi:hypothetical protein
MSAVGDPGGGTECAVAQTAEIVEAVEALEALNPTVDPAASALVSGTWSLLFTGGVNEATAAERRRREGAVGSAVTGLTGAAASAASSSSSAPLLKGGDPTPLGRRVTTQAGVVNNRGNTQVGATALWLA